jgi:hypothetical protein
MRAGVILRVVTGRVPAASLDDVVAAYRRDYVPVATAATGLDRFLVAARPIADGGHELAAMTLWASLEAALATYGGDLTAVRTLDGRNHGETFTGVDYYEVDAEGARRGSGSATRLRLTAGTVAHGLDADIQQQLRRNLPELPGEVVDAFVGRRALGAVVEIALVTTWTAAPAGVSLEAPIWPSISARYDTFRIAVHDILIEGSGAD